MLWVYAALFEVAMHTVFMGTFGADYLVVAFHVFTVGGLRCRRAGGSPRDRKLIQILAIIY